MKKIISLSIIAVMSACNTDTAGERKSGYFELPRGISVQTVDGCEYIYCEVNQGVCIVHKQNCKNHQP